MVSQFLAGRKHVLDSHQLRTALQIVGQFYPIPTLTSTYQFGTYYLLRCRIASVPTTWDETRVLAAKAGDYYVVAKRKGAKWFIGAILSSQRWLVRLVRITGILGFEKYCLIDGIRDYKLMPFLLSI